jgi:diguanylate cyclase (GGDEF)-like protein
MLGGLMTVFFILLVAGLNLGIGFAAAMYLGVGPKTWPPAWPAWDDPAEDEATLAPSDAAPESIEVEDLAASLDALPTVDELPVEPVREEPAEDSDDANPLEHPLATALTQLARGFDRFEGELADWDSRRRAEALDADALTNCAIELSGLAKGYLDQFQQTLDQLAELCGHDPRHADAREEIAASAGALSNQLRIVSAELGSLQFETDDPNLAMQRLTTTSTEVLAALHAARNRLEEPLVALLDEALAEPQLAAALAENAGVNLLGRLYFEHLWHQHATARLAGEGGSLAMLDVDQLRHWNATQGPLIARRALGAVGEIAAEILPAGHPVMRLAGKQFIAFLPQHAPQNAAEAIEQIRQGVENARLCTADDELAITVSAAVVAATSETSAAAILARLRETVAEAKSYGRNRTFLWDTSSPAPVVPPKLSVKRRVIAL